MADYSYDEKTVSGFIASSIFWGVVGIVIGLWISAQMWMPSLNIPPYFTFGRMRAVHTNGLAFGLGVGAIFGLSYYIVMRLAKRPLLFPKLARFHLYLFNIAIVLAALSQSLEYAELEWPLDIPLPLPWDWGVDVFYMVS